MKRTVTSLLLLAALLAGRARAEDRPAEPAAEDLPGTSIRQAQALEDPPAEEPAPAKSSETTEDGAVPAQAMEELPPLEELTLLEPEPEPEPPIKLWEKSVELGINGTSGNSETFDTRVGVHCKRESDASIFKFDTDYQKNTSAGVETANRLFSEARHELLFCDSPWTLFVHATLEYDEFRPFDVRWSADTGVGYQFIKTDAVSFTGRVGAGVSQEIGGPDNSYVPEGVFGLDYEHQLTARTKIVLRSEYFPDWTDFGEYRINSRGELNFLLDDVLNISLNMGVTDRYDSTPNGAEPNDLSYFTTLLWKY